MRAEWIKSIMWLRSEPGLRVAQWLLVAVFASLFGLWLFGIHASSAKASSDAPVSTIEIGNSRIDVVDEGGQPALLHSEILPWVRAAAEAVTAYYGRYPVPHVSIRVIPFAGKGIRGGKTFGREDGGAIRIRVGTETTAADLQRDWMMTHEMVHLSFPSLAERHHWLEEGIATYVEPIARVQAKHMQAAEMWSELIRGLPQGFPQAGDQGLDNTHTWGRTYWGGALFCFLADVEIRRATNNQKGLQDALRGILAAGGDIRRDWKIEKALTIGDRAAGVSVLVPLYTRMKDQPVDVDLNTLWKQLGVQLQGNGVRFSDQAPLAATRIAITASPASASSYSEKRSKLKMSLKPVSK
jgi:hypothetical protein